MQQKTATTFKRKNWYRRRYLIKIWWGYKGGVALSIAHQVEVPLRFIGIGEKKCLILKFYSDRIVSRLLGLGDIEGLAEKHLQLLMRKNKRS